LVVVPEVVSSIVIFQCSSGAGECCTFHGSAFAFFDFSVKQTFRGKLNPESMQLIADKFNTSVNTLEQDWLRQSTWEPLIWESIKSDADAKQLIAQLTTRKQLLEGSWDAVAGKC